MTQYQQAKSEVFSPEVAAAAQRDQIDPATLQKAIAAGTAVIPANKIHLAGALKPIAIGTVVSTKINANLGASPLSSSDKQELAKLQLSIDLGADTVMDLSRKPGAPGSRFFHHTCRDTQRTPAATEQQANGHGQPRRFLAGQMDVVSQPSESTVRRI